MIQFLAHGESDNVAVAVVDVKAGEKTIIRSLEDQKDTEIQTTMDIPLGHKVALKDLSVDDTIIKYDHDIGRVVESIKKGDHVHVHNVKTKKW